MDEDNSPCGEQWTCEVFDCGTKLKCHYHRVSEKCRYYSKPICPQYATQLVGQSCDLSKMRRLRPAVASELNEAWH